MTDQELLTLAEEYGFDCAAPMDATKLEVLQDVRDACAANRCGQYNKTWPFGSVTNLVFPQSS